MSTDIRLYPFQCGSTIIPLRNHILGAGLAGEMITTPVIWFLLTHPRGNVIIDGGNPAAVAIPELKHWGKILEMSSVEMSPDEEVTVVLEQHGFDLADVRWIVQSHLHLDHTGAVAAIERFPNAQVLVTRTRVRLRDGARGVLRHGLHQGRLRQARASTGSSSRTTRTATTSSATASCAAGGRPGTRRGTSRSRFTCRAATR